MHYLFLVSYIIYLVSFPVQMFLSIFFEFEKYFSYNNPSTCRYVDKSVDIYWFGVNSKMSKQN